MDIEFDQPELDIELNPPREDGEPEGITGIDQEPGEDPTMKQDTVLTEPDTDDDWLRDKVTDSRQPTYKDENEA